MTATPMERDDCILCGTAGRVLYTQLRDRYFDTPGLSSLYECPSCALVWLHPKPVAAEIPALYQEYYTHEAPQGDSWLHRMVQRAIPAVAFAYEDRSLGAFDRFAARALAGIGPIRELAEHSVMWLHGDVRGRVLDVGCGSGDFLANMQRLGWRVAGVEPDPGGAAQTRKRLGIDEIYTDLAALPDDSFDAVTLSHVFEHLIDPADTLRGCLRVLAPRGRLVLTTPNSDSLGRRHFGPAWNHWDPPRHVHVFSLAPLVALIERAGFEVETAATPSSSSHFVWQISSHIRDREKLPGITLENPSLWLKFTSVLFWAVEHALTLAGRQRGEELLVIARKPAAKRRAD